jgi:hypothetical protein
MTKNAVSGSALKRMRNHNTVQYTGTHFGPVSHRKKKKNYADIKILMSRLSEYLSSQSMKYGPSIYQFGT